MLVESSVLGAGKTLNCVQPTCVLVTIVLFSHVPYTQPFLFFSFLIVQLTTA